VGVLRVILAIAVVVGHANIHIQRGSTLFGLKLPDGVASVQVFFIISGFYITMILDKKYVGKGSYGLFLTNRFLRLYPVYWIVTAVAVLASFMMYAAFGNWLLLSVYSQYLHFMNIKTFLFLLFANIALFGQSIVAFLGMHPENGSMFFTPVIANHPPFWRFLINPPAWTLGIELIFYVIAPFIVRRNVSVILAFIAASFCARGITYAYFSPYDPWNYRFFPSELALFLLGSLSYKMYLWLRHRSKANKKQSSLIGQIVFMCFFYSIFIFYQFLPLRHIYLYRLFNWPLYVFTCLSLPIIFQFSKSSAWDNRVGELSYPIYISHFPIIFLIRPLIVHFRLNAFAGELSVLCAIIVSYLLLRTISDPIEKIRQNRVTTAQRCADGVSLEYQLGSATGKP
jgi:peptidoglycan/LPS O-acetylase OafA/YrhL